MKKSTVALFFMLAFAAGLTFWELPAFDPDLGWQLFGGAWILEHLQVPRADPINAFNVSWLDYHWLAQIALYRLFSAGGFELLRTALGVTMGIFICVAAATALRVSRNFYAALFTAAGSFLLLSEIAQVRPQMVALLLLAIAQHILAANYGRRTKQVPLPHLRYELFLLFCITVLLANIHVYWLFVPILWGLYRVLPRILKRRAPSPAYAWGGLLLLGAAPLVSPYGLFQANLSLQSVLQNYLLIFDYLDIPKVLKQWVLEFRSAFALENYRAWICVVYLVFVAHSADRTVLKRRLPEFLSVAIALILCVRGSKYIGLLAVFSVPYIAWTLKRTFRRWTMPDFLTRAGFANSILSAGALFTALYAGYYFPFTHRNNEFIDTVEPFSICQRLPDLALGAPPVNSALRILTHFNHGGWCRFALYLRNPKLDWRVTTDNRTQGVPEYHYVESFDLFGLRGDWIKTLQLWNPQVAVISKKSPLATYMALARGAWKMVLQDDEFAVFVPNN